MEYKICIISVVVFLLAVSVITGERIENDASNSGNAEGFDNDSGRGVASGVAGRADVTNRGIPKGGCK